MYYPYTGRSVAARDVREYIRVFQEIDGERLELASFAARGEQLRESFGSELTRHKERLCDLSELEETMMIRTRYVDFEPHWRAHQRFRRFLSTADTRKELFFCSDWLRQHETSADMEFREWLRHSCAAETQEDFCDCFFRTDPERILLTVKMQIF